MLLPILEGREIREKGFSETVERSSSLGEQCLYGKSVSPNIYFFLRKAS